MDRLSFTGCLQILPARCGMRQHDPQGLNQWYRLLLAEMAREKIQQHRNRVNPRVVEQELVQIRQETTAAQPTTALEESFVETVVIFKRVQLTNNNRDAQSLALPRSCKLISCLPLESMVVVLVTTGIMWNTIRPRRRRVGAYRNAGSEDACRTPPKGDKSP